mmetsp:Transcript_38778/g.28673  ORF Transcript_38778/g.28673 Transcript_38778/m.28673 type:complete len:101 (+) Transcript_38778:2775-3077(+)
MLKFEELQIEEQRDIIGRSVMHYVVKGTDLGTYDNIELFNYLLEKGFNANLEDNDRMRPIDYIKIFKGSKIHKKLLKLKIKESNEELKKSPTKGKASKSK